MLAFLWLGVFIVCMYVCYVSNKISVFSIQSNHCRAVLGYKVGHFDTKSIKQYFYRTTRHITRDPAAPSISLSCIRPSRSVDHGGWWGS